MGKDLRQHFGRMLRLHMLERGWGPADLAREATKFLKEKKISRGSTAQYVRGILPDAERLDALAKAIGVSWEDLVSPEPQPFEILPHQDGLALLRVNLVVPYEIAMDVAAALAPLNRDQFPGAKAGT